MSTGGLRLIPNGQSLYRLKLKLLFGLSEPIDLEIVDPLPGHQPGLIRFELTSQEVLSVLVSSPAVTSQKAHCFLTFTVYLPDVKNHFVFVHSSCV